MGVDDALLSGSGAVRLGAVPKVDFDLKGEKLDLDGWLGSTGQGGVPLPPPRERLHRPEQRSRLRRPPTGRSPR